MAAKNKRRPVSGWLNFDKSLDISSAQAVNRLRWLFFARKAGHAGTLDPLATGVLPIAFGEATKTVSYLMDAEKEYRFTLCWGASTTTDDMEGDIVETSAHRPSSADIEAALPHFTGVVMQTPPIFSAVKQQGQRAYALARDGLAVKLAPREVRIDAITFLEQPDEDHAVFQVQCGKGTYIRALARDLAEFLGTKGHVSALRRTRVGAFEEKNAFGLEKCMDLVHIAARTEVEVVGSFDTIGETKDFTALDRLLLPLTTVLDDIPVLPINEQETAHVKMGRSILVPPKLLTGFPANAAVVALQVTQPVAIGRLDEGRFHPTRVFNLEA